MWDRQQISLIQTLWATAVLCMLTSIAIPAIAQPIGEMGQMNQMSQGGSSSTKGELAIGMATPSPTGITIKYWTTRKEAYDLFAEWDFSGNKYNVHFDYLTHDFNQLFMDDADTPVYYGIGIRLIEEEGRDFITGIRIPIGFSYLSRSKPFDLFAEAAPRVNFTPSTNFGLDLQVGIRYRMFK